MTLDAALSAAFAAGATRFALITVGGGWACSLDDGEAASGSSAVDAVRAATAERDYLFIEGELAEPITRVRVRGATLIVSKREGRVVTFTERVRSVVPVLPGDDCELNL